MIYLEVALLTITIFTCIYATITDFKYGIIKNKSLLMAMIPCVIINIFYYGFFAKEYVKLYLINFSVLALTSILFYAYHIWSAGDSKLLIFTIFGLPARLYLADIQGVAPTLTILILIFSLAFIYVIIESVYLGIKQKDLLEIKALKFNIIKFVKQYIYCTVYMTGINKLLIMLLPNFYQQNMTLMGMLNLLIVLTIFNFEIFQKKPTFIVGLGIMATIWIMSQSSNFTFLGIKRYLILALIIILRSKVERYNYTEIDTKDIKPGMVLSYGTVLMFRPSRVKGLPLTTTEDLRSKITQEQAESILRWENSKYGQSKITIVRKMPFAVFITLGTVIFIILRKYL